MNIKIVSLIFLINLILISCSNNSQSNKYLSVQLENKDTVMNIELIKSTLEDQNRVESDELEFENPYILSYKDFDIEKKLLYEGLLKKGYRPVSSQVFNKKISDIFKISPNSESNRVLVTEDYTVYFGELLDGNRETLIANIFQLPNITRNIFFVTKENIILEMLLLQSFVTINDNNTYTVNVPDYIVHRNKYLFNDSKASLTWLKLNDTYFMESLVKTFGYVEDKDLLQWVVSETFSNKNYNSEDYNSLFFMKSCSDQFIFHQATFDLLKEKIDRTSLEALKRYLDNRNENEDLQNLSFEHKAKVLAHVLYIGEYFAHQEPYPSSFLFKFMGPFYEYDDQRDRYDEEFAKNNYYNLPDFKKLWQDAKEEGDGLNLPM